MKKDGDTIEFTVNGHQYEVNRDVDADTRLVDFLRRTALLTGTKVMCREGGCGACIVTLAAVDPVLGKKEYRSVNSCLMPLLSCHGSEITTIEGIGNKKDGYHPLQSRLADMNGTQCGFCSSGMIMSTFSLMERRAGHGITMKDVEVTLDGNVCRCTGYRPIMDAFKTFASDVPSELKSSCVDLEDLGKKSSICSGASSGMCKENAGGRSCSGHFCQSANTKIFQLGNWYRPNSLEQLIKLFDTFGDNVRYRLVAGNTGTGVYKNDGPYDAYVDITRIGELHQITRSTPLTIGGGVTISNWIELFDTIGSVNSDYWYAPNLAEHFRKIGSVSIRNAATIAGNLILKHAHNESLSDVFVILETVGTKLNIMNRSGQLKQISLSEFLQFDMKDQLILSLTLPPLSADHVIRTYKIMPRSANAYAYINAGFCAKVQSSLVIEKPRIVFGGIRPSLVHVSRTEEFLTGKNLEDEKVFQAALAVLDQELSGEDDWEELNPLEDWLNPDMNFLKTVAQGLFYKFVLNVLGNKVAPKLQSGATNLQRGLSSGKQDFSTDEGEWPISKPIIKVEARAQCAGEAQYFDDIPYRPDELHGAFVISTVGNCEIARIDATEALNAEGVVAFYDANSIKEGNKFLIAGEGFGITDDEEVFCTGKVKYAGQSLGLIVARTQSNAIRAAKLVHVEYKNMQTPVLAIKDALNYPERVRDRVASSPSKKLNADEMEGYWASSDTVVEGEFQIGGQYHFYMETLVSLCIPTEDGVDLYCATQDQDAVQNVVAQSLRIDKCRVNMQTRRLGGGYGGKITRGHLVAVASAIAANELSKPVRIQLDLNSNMALIGGRLPYYCKYKAGTDSDGILQAVEMMIVSDCGSNFNEGTAEDAAYYAKNCYTAKAWNISGKLVVTDTSSNTPCRSPGTTQGIGIIEQLMEHLAKVRKEDPLEFRLKNLDKSEGKGDSLKNIVEQLRQSSDYDNRLRAVREFNEANRWKKRGIHFLPMAYAVDYPPSQFNFNVLVAILHHDGSVAVSHGGIEMGQGINTKVAQVVAKELGVDLSLVSIKPTNTLTNANGSVTGGSMTSELNCYAALKACQELKERMQPFKDKMPDADWKTLVEQCYNSNVDLTARHYYTANDRLSNYVIHGATVSEVEIDVLTGEKEILRVDLLEDAGQSISPLVDIGQVEGAFVMGIGLWTSEKITYDPATGQKLTNGTWNYKPPLNRDIPIDFRVTLLKNAGHPFGVLRSKATGEPPLCMAITVFFALRNAVEAARSDAGEAGWYPMDGPATIEKLQKMMLVKPEMFSFYST